MGPNNLCYVTCHFLFFSLCPHVTFCKTLRSRSTVFIKGHGGYNLVAVSHVSHFVFTNVEPSKCLVWHGHVDRTLVYHIYSIMKFTWLATAANMAKGYLFFWLQISLLSHKISVFCKRCQQYEIWIKTSTKQHAFFHLANFLLAMQIT